MKKLVTLIICMLCIFGTCSAYNLVINSKFKPLSYEEMYMAAMAKAAYDREMKERFEYYKEKAYDCYSKEDWNGFLTYSNYALQTGWYNARMYYDRGVVYEKFNEFKLAKKEYKKAKKKGYSPADAALKALKAKEKEYKRLKKLYKK